MTSRPCSKQWPVRFIGLYIVKEQNLVLEFVVMGVFLIQRFNPLFKKTICLLKLFVRLLPS